MGLRPLRCEHCGSTRITYIRLGPEDEVALCSMCQRVTEPREPTEEQAQEDLVLHLQALRRKQEQPESERDHGRRKRKRGSSGMGLILFALGVAGLLAGVVFARHSLMSQDRSEDRSQRMEPLVPQRRAPQPVQEPAAPEVPSAVDDEEVQPSDG